MKICHLTINTIDYERRIKNQAESSSLSGDHVWVMALSKPNETYSDMEDNFNLYNIKTPFFKGGPLKFIDYNLKVLFYLVAKPFEIIHCHDLWTLPAIYILSLIKKFSFVYDAHEYFDGLEIFNKNKIRKKLWMLVEKVAVKRVDVLITVSEPIARLYSNKYPELEDIEVIRNFPKYELLPDKPADQRFPNTDKKIILYQGHFRPGRGLMQLIEAMSTIEEAHLVLIGGGELEDEILGKIKSLNIKDKISLIGYIPTKELIRVAAAADLGVVLFEPTSLNYTYALPNKFFEYIMAGIPVLASTLETFESYIDQYKTGMTVDPGDVTAIAQTIKLMLSNEDKLKHWQNNARKASEILNWENESVKLIKIYDKIRN